MIGALTLKGQIIVGVIAATILITGAGFGVHKLRSDAFKAGVASEQAASRKALDKANEANAKVTSGLRETMAAQAARIALLNDQRKGREQVIVTRVEEALPAQPNCEITPEIVALRNQIRNQ